MKVYINSKKKSLLPSSYCNVLKHNEEKEIYVGNLYYVDPNSKSVLVKLKPNIYGWSDTDNNLTAKKLGIILEQGRYWWLPSSSVIYKNNFIMDTE